VPDAGLKAVSDAGLRKRVGGVVIAQIGSLTPHRYTPSSYAAAQSVASRGRWRLRPPCPHSAAGTESAFKTTSSGEAGSARSRRNP
jgi:hypothetical protein